MIVILVTQSSETQTTKNYCTVFILDAHYTFCCFSNAIFTIYQFCVTKNFWDYHGWLVLWWWHSAFGFFKSTYMNTSWWWISYCYRMIKWLDMKIYVLIELNADWNRIFIRDFAINYTSLLSTYFVSGLIIVKVKRKCKGPSFWCLHLCNICHECFVNWVALTFEI